MKKLLCLLVLLVALMGMLVVDLIGGKPESVELAERVETARPTTAPRHRPGPSGAAELQRVIRMGAE